MGERRDDSRRRVLKSAKISFNNGMSCIDCSVRNVSSTGACLEVVSPVGVPSKFELLIQDERFARPCYVAWRGEKRIGVAFY
ncbi:MAG: PilZ domain-containing protein [Methylocystis sp.]